MAKIHMVLQGKGGVGKSMISALIAQYKIAQGNNVLCIDTDPVNSTLKGYKSLNVQLLDILQDNKINSRQFDILIEKISDTDCDIVIDNGASSFVALSDYLISNAIPQIINDIGHDLLIHTVITGGQALPDTVEGFISLAETFGEKANLVIWLNPFFGVIEHEGADFYHMRVYLNNAQFVSGVIELPNFPTDTFGRDFNDLLQARKTFAESINNPSLTIMNRHRLKMMQKEIFSNIASCGVI